jgi:hypothetical protein
MATAPRAELGDVLFKPGSDTVTIAYTVLEGLSAGKSGTITTTQTALAAHAGATNWGDADLLALAQTQLDAENAHVTAVLAS